MCKCTFIHGHRTLKAPHPVRSAKLTRVPLSQYHGGGPRGNPGCCGSSTFYFYFSFSSSQLTTRQNFFPRQLFQDTETCINRHVSHLVHTHISYKCQSSMGYHFFQTKGMHVQLIFLHVLSCGTLSIYLVRACNLIFLIISAAVSHLLCPCSISSSHILSISQSFFCQSLQSEFIFIPAITALYLCLLFSLSAHFLSILLLIHMSPCFLKIRVCSLYFVSFQQQSYIPVFFSLSVCSYSFLSICSLCLLKNKTLESVSFHFS